MQKQTIRFAVVTTDAGQIKTIGKSVITHPKANFSGGSIKWHEDKMKSHAKNGKEFTGVSENA